MRNKFFVPLILLPIVIGGIYATAQSQEAPVVEKPAAIPPQNAPIKPADAEDDRASLRVTPDTGGKVRASIIRNAPLRSDYVMGDPDAPIVMVEYASLSCPHCAHFSNTVLPVLEEKYVKTGKMAYILRNFALNEPALRGAMLLHCVGDSSTEKYYTFARVLFDAQPRWAFDENFLSSLETIATVGGLSKKQFNDCVRDMDREIEVLKLKKEAADELQIPHTPYLYIAGEAYEGEKTAEAVSRFIDAKLAEIAPKK